MSQLCTGTLLKHQTVTLMHSHRFDAQSGIGQWARTVNADVTDNTPALKTLWHTAPDWLASLPLQQSMHLDQGGDAAEPDVTRLQLSNAHDPKLAAGLRYGWRHWLTLLDMHRPSKTAPANPCSDAQAVALLKAFTEFSVLCAVREGPLGVVQLNAQVEHALGALAQPGVDAAVGQHFGDEGARHDGAFVHVEGHALQPGFVREVGGR
jgi:exodeoxyribonuclease V alpha subunit